MNTFTEEIMALTEETDIQLCCFTASVEPTGDGFFFVGDKYAGTQRMTRTELFHFLRENNCWNDNDRTIQYLTMNGENWKMTWNHYELDRWTYTGTIRTAEFDDD